MSGRGRGRGGGRGGGYVPPTGGKLFLMRSAEECGLDSRNLRSLQDITHPALFPDILLHSNGGDPRLVANSSSNNNNNRDDTTVQIEEGKENRTLEKRSAATTALISKGREIHHRMQISVFYVRPTKDVPDVIRYSDSRPLAQIDASAVLSHCLGGRKRTAMGCFVPDELVSGQRRGGVLTTNYTGRASGGATSSFAELEARERQRRKREEDGETEEQKEDEGGEEDLEQEEEGEEEDGEDYVANYYESEGDDSGGDGGDEDEPTF